VEAVVTSPHTYFGYTLWPVLDDDTGHVMFWDVHDRNDTNGNGEPIGSLFATIEDAKTWVRKWRRDEAFIRALDRLLFE